MCIILVYCVVSHSNQVMAIRALSLLLRPLGLVLNQQNLQQKLKVETNLCMCSTPLIRALFVRSSNLTCIYTGVSAAASCFCPFCPLLPPQKSIGALWSSLLFSMRASYKKYLETFFFFKLHFTSCISFCFLKFTIPKVRNDQLRQLMHFKGWHIKVSLWLVYILCLVAG